MWCDYNTNIEDRAFITLLQNGWTPLHCASYGGHKDLVEALIERGVQVDIKNKVLIVHDMSLCAWWVNVPIFKLTMPLNELTNNDYSFMWACIACTLNYSTTGHRCDECTDISVHTRPYMYFDNYYSDTMLVKCWLVVLLLICTGWTHSSHDGQTAWSQWYCEHLERCRVQGTDMIYVQTLGGVAVKTNIWRGFKVKDAKTLKVPYSRSISLRTIIHYRAEVFRRCSG